MYISFIGFLILILSSCATIDKSPEKLYVYHNFSPFIIATPGQPSLSNYFVNHLNYQYNFNYIVTPINRKDLNQLIKEGEPVRLLWANPQWFPNEAPETSEPIIWDSDVLLSSSHNNTEVLELSTLKNKRFCAIQGHFYKHLEPWLSDGVITRVDGNSLLDCLEKIQLGKVDYMQVERSSLYNNDFSSQLGAVKIIEPALDSFTRHILLFNTEHSEFEAINKAIKSLKTDRQWEQGLHSFGNERFIKLFELKLEQLMTLEIL